MPHGAEGAASRAFTIGHSSHSLDELTALLRGAGVQGVADVRRFPGSRRHPHLAGEALAVSLPEHGVAYDHLAGLGGRRRKAPGSPNDGWEVEAFGGYADHMATPEFEAALERLQQLARVKATAVMCAEAPWWRCHRRLVSDALVVRGWTVCHVMPDGRVVEHALTEFAVVEGVSITYPSPQMRLG